jgi:hypothetical protein
MFSLAALQVVAKCVSVALLAATNVTWLVYYLSGDMMLYLVYKLIRGDFIYVIPVPLTAAVPLSLLVRVVEKTITDFTGCMIMRLPYQMGGAYYSFNMLMNFISVPGITHLYLEYAESTEEEGGAEKLGAVVLWTFNVVILLTSAALFAFFLFRVIVPRFRKTFLSTQTGWELAENCFLDNEEDEKRIHIFTDNAMMWSRIKEDVRAWTLSSWETWDREQPAWFTPLVIASVPDDFIPPRYLARLGGARERRGSAVGSVWESLRRVSNAGVTSVE